MQLFAGPICDGITCTPFILVFFGQFLIDNILVILGTAFISIGGIPLIIRLKANRNSSTRPNVALITIGVILLLIHTGGELAKDYSRNRHIKNNIDRIDFKVYELDKSSPPEIRMIDYSTESKVPYLMTRYSDFYIFQFNTEYMHESYPDSLTDCGVKYPETGQFFETCEYIGQTESGINIFSNYQDNSLAPVVSLGKYGNTTVTIRFAFATKETKKRTLEIYNSLEETDINKLKFNQK